MSREPEDLQDLLQSGYRYALALTRQREAAEDVLHEACLSLAKTDGPWKRRLLFRAIKHRFIDAYRQQQRRPQTQTGDEAYRFAEDAQGGVLATLVQTDSVEAALRCLSDDEREAVLLAWVEGYTARETAKQLGRPRGTVLSLLHRARKKLRDRLGEPAASDLQTSSRRKAEQ
ncbi:RNA polymerase sigma factor [Algisphaera agarilytica]|uniref:RNA polymerase sigma-70 factor (ECF subfamily) n=1 Tax=Algisphaera agarilytica TaxID=1385975 RepID=A0A7X0LJ90_9BACT|nr:RNA polymerase sigma factor [Algisphaera agarilytica]MBB6428356.1 RNA polymerase sigma-70 factor (ECF subfamily) [Algisphaera agarilytica]